jgi:CheY-like chemotaxis protein
MFGKVVKDKRLALGLSQEDFAELAGLHRTYVSDVERGLRNLSLESIEKLAQALELSIATLFTQTGIGAGPDRLAEILIIEDNLHDWKGAQGVLRKAHLANRLQIVHGGAEALEFIFCEGAHAARKFGAAPRLILLDLELPGWDGLKVLQRIKRDPRTRTIPVIALCSSKDQYDLVKSHDLGVDGYIVKPVTFERLVEAVQRLGWHWMLLDQPPKMEA